MRASRAAVVGAVAAVAVGAWVVLHDVPTAVGTRDATVPGADPAVPVAVAIADAAVPVAVATAGERLPVAASDGGLRGAAGATGATPPDGGLRGAAGATGATPPDGGLRGAAGATGATPPDDRTRRLEIAKALAADPGVRLGKAELRSTLKAIAPRLSRCYEQARALDRDVSGVINTKLTIRNEPVLGMTVTVNGFDTHGRLGQSRAVLACVTSTFEAEVFTPIATRGRRDLTYPMTFAPQPPDNRDSGVVVEAERAATAGRWADALARAERGLELTSLDGTFRRRLIGVAGLAACHLKLAPTARHYVSLASPDVEERLVRACRDVAIDLLD